MALKDFTSGARAVPQRGPTGQRGLAGVAGKAGLRGQRGDQGLRGQAGEDGADGAAGGSSDLTLTAAEDIAAFMPVNIDGTVADSSSPSDIGRLAGISTASIASGFAGSVRRGGSLTTTYNFTPGAPVFINGNGLSQIAPSIGWSQKVGLAKSATEIWLEIEQPILL